MQGSLCLALQAREGTSVLLSAPPLEARVWHNVFRRLEELPEDLLLQGSMAVGPQPPPGPCLGGNSEMASVTCFSACCGPAKGKLAGT